MTNTSETDPLATNPLKNLPHLLKAEAIAALPETVTVHRLNPNAVRHTKSIGDTLGLQHLGIHLVRLQPGKESTQFHLHHREEEFLYILSGRGIAEIGANKIEVGAGDFMAFTAPSLPHSLHNPFPEDLVYLMGGERLDMEVCDYPRIHKRQFRINQERHLIDLPN